MLRATKEKNLARLKALRFLKSQIDAAAKDKLSDLTTEEVQKVLRRKIKQSEEAREKFESGGRPELASAEQAEIELVSQYLPKDLSPNELRSAVDKIVASLGAVTIKDFGRVMGAVMKQVAGAASGTEVKAAVERALNK